MRIVMMLIAVLLGAQQAPDRFEVASVKPNRSGPEGMRTLTTVPGGVRVINLPLATIFGMAHQMQPDQILNMPDWAKAEAFDINARAPEGAPMNFDTFRPMLVNLLVDRFALKTHHETRELSVYRLVRARDNQLGPKLSEAAVDCTGRDRTAQPRTPEAMRRLGTCGAGPTPTGLRVHGMPLRTLAALLAPNVGRVVVDETGLSGLWDLDLEFTSEVTRGADGVSVFAALQEQLGLKLESGRAPVDVVVIERLERPSDD